MRCSVYWGGNVDLTLNSREVLTIPRHFEPAKINQHTQINYTQVHLATVPS